MSYNKELGVYEGYIYCIENMVNGKKYIGQTITTIERRWNSHCSASKCGEQAIYRAMRKYGVENFRISMLDAARNADKDVLLSELNDMEIFYIDKYRTLTVDGGYNSTKGGDNVSEKVATPVDQYTVDGVLVNSYDSIRSAANATGVYEGSISMNIMNHNKTGGGYIWTRRGELPNLKIKPLYSKKIFQYTKEGKLVNTYDRVTDAARQLNIHQTGISAVLNKCDYTYKGYVWIDEDHHFTENTARHRKIVQYDTFGIIVNMFNNAAEAENCTGVDSASILQSCHGNYCSAGYYIWRFDGENFDKYPLASKMRPVAAYDVNGKEISRYHHVKEAVCGIKCRKTGIYQSIKTGCKCDGLYWKYLD